MLNKFMFEKILIKFNSNKSFYVLFLINLDLVKTILLLFKVMHLTEIYF